MDEHFLYTNGLTELMWVFLWKLRKLSIELLLDIYFCQIKDDLNYVSGNSASFFITLNFWFQYALKQKPLTTVYQMFDLNSEK